MMSNFANFFCNKLLKRVKFLYVKASFTRGKRKGAIETSRLLKDKLLDELYDFSNCNLI